MCKLRVRFSQSPERRGVFCYALKVEVTMADGIPPKIFVYHQMPPGIEGNTFAEFDHVATPVDFQEIPEDAASETVPWYRTDKCTVWVRSVADLKTAKQLMVDDISGLQKTFDTLVSDDDFTNQTTVEFSDVHPGAHVVPQDSGLAKEARDEAQRCRALYMNCAYQDEEVNQMLLGHATLLRKLAAAIDGPDAEDLAWQEFTASLSQCGQSDQSSGASD